MIMFSYNRDVLKSRSRDVLLKSLGFGLGLHSLVYISELYYYYYCYYYDDHDYYDVD